jgi:ubiquitin-protein ligase
MAGNNFRTGEYIKLSKNLIKCFILFQIGSPYEGGKWKIQIDFNNKNYPINPPKVKYFSHHKASFCH